MVSRWSVAIRRRQIHTVRRRGRSRRRGYRDPPCTRAAVEHVSNTFWTTPMMATRPTVGLAEWRSTTCDGRGAFGGRCENAGSRRRMRRTADNGARRREPRAHRWTRHRELRLSRGSANRWIRSTGAERRCARSTLPRMKRRAYRDASNSATPMHTGASAKHSKPAHTYRATRSVLPQRHCIGYQIKKFKM